MNKWGVGFLAKNTNVNVDRIKERSTYMGITMKYLAGCIGKYPNYLSCVRNGTDSITDEELRIIADRLSTTVQYLTGQTDDPEPVLMEDEKRLAQLIRTAKRLTLHQMDVLLSIAEDIEDECLHGFPDEYTELTNDKRDLIGAIINMPDDEVSILRKIDAAKWMSVGATELVELSTLYCELEMSGKRQLLGKAYELLDLQNRAEK